MKLGIAAVVFFDWSEFHGDALDGEPLDPPPALEAAPFAAEVTAVADYASEVRLRVAARCDRMARRRAGWNT